MEKINKNISNKISLKSNNRNIEFGKILNNLLKGDILMVYYSSVGDTTKIKGLVGVFEGFRGKGLNKSFILLLKKGGINIRLRLFIYSSLLFNIRVIKSTRKDKI